MEKEKEMAEQCDHDCASCGQDCASRTVPPKAEHGKIKKVIGVVSGKGGVGKTSVAAMLAAAAARRGAKTAVLDADVTGPSIPAMFGVHSAALTDGKKILPAVTDGGVKLISVNMMLHDEDAPVLWRGPVISGLVKQFWDEVEWGDIDLMFVDMPPGTGDVALTVFQSLPVDGIVVVTSPQQLVSMIVGKAVNMAKMMHVPIVGIVENYSWYDCPDCGSRHYIFGQGKPHEVAAKYSLAVLAQLPFRPEYAQMADRGEIEKIECKELDAALDVIEAFEVQKTANAD